MFTSGDASVARYKPIGWRFAAALFKLPRLIANLDKTSL